MKIRTNSTIYDYQDIYGSNDNTIPLPDTLLDWMSVTRKFIDGEIYSLIPYQYWIKIYEDERRRQYWRFARQLFKTTGFANILGFWGSVRKGSTAFYVAPSEDKLAKFADQKYRYETIQRNVLLRSMIEGPATGMPGHRSKMNWKTGSFSYHVTDEGNYGKVEGGSADVILADEVQEQDLEAFGVATEATSKKDGIIILAGVGPEANSAADIEWNKTDKAEWHYNNEEDYIDSAGKICKKQGWRNKLLFGEYKNQWNMKKNGLLFGEYMTEVCAGYWEETGGKNNSYAGYTLSQESACHIPLTIADAVNLYHKAPEESIEWKVANRPKALVESHVFGRAYSAQRKPVTRRDVITCMEKYRWMDFWSGRQVTEMKQMYPDNIRIFMGVDYGSGRTGASSTVASVILKWRAFKMVDGNSYRDYTADRYFLVATRKLSYRETHLMLEAHILNRMANDYSVDFGVSDMGFGEMQTKTIITGGINPETMERFSGLGTARWAGAFSRGKKPEAVVEEKLPVYNELGNKRFGMIRVDHTHMIDDFCNLLKDYYRPGLKRFAIPYKDSGGIAETIITDFTSIIRADLDADLLSVKMNIKQNPSKHYAHPPDRVVSICLCRVAENKYENANTGAGVITKNRHRYNSRIRSRR